MDVFQRCRLRAGDTTLRNPLSSNTQGCYRRLLRPRLSLSPHQLSGVLRRWIDEDQLDHLLSAIATCHTTSPAPACTRAKVAHAAVCENPSYRRALSTNTARGRPSASATRCIDISPTFCSPRSMLDM
jgi:hypothetical protein